MSAALLNSLAHHALPYAWLPSENIPLPVRDHLRSCACAGHSVARYIANPAPCNTQIVALGVDAYLKMLLHDNFVHTDLHPGNILVRERATPPDRSDRGQPRHSPNQAPPSGQQAATPQRKQSLQLVLLDFGLAEELNPTVRRHFISLLHMIGKGTLAPL